MDLLSLSTEYNRNINIESLSTSDMGLKTRICIIDGVVLIESTSLLSTKNSTSLSLSTV